MIKKKQPEYSLRYSYSPMKNWASIAPMARPYPQTGALYTVGGGRGGGVGKVDGTAPQGQGSSWGGWFGWSGFLPALIVIHSSCCSTLR